MSYGTDILFNDFSVLTISIELGDVIMVGSQLCLVMVLSDEESSLTPLLTRLSILRNCEGRYGFSEENF